MALTWPAGPGILERCKMGSHDVVCGSMIYVKLVYIGEAGIQGWEAEQKRAFISILLFKSSGVSFKRVHSDGHHFFYHSDLPAILRNGNRNSMAYLIDTEDKSLYSPTL
jgi:hypothetical protein